LVCLGERSRQNAGGGETAAAAIGCPPDLEAAATKTVVQQAEWLVGDNL